MLDEGNAISIGCCRKRKQNTEEFESLNFHQTVRVINVLFTWQVEHGYRSCERCCNDFLCCLQANYPVLVINNTVWAHEWHRLHFGYLSKGGGVDVLHGECWMCACWGVWSFLVLQVKAKMMFMWYGKVSLKLARDLALTPKSICLPKKKMARKELRNHVILVQHSFYSFKGQRIKWGNKILSAKVNTRRWRPEPITPQNI